MDANYLLGIVGIIVSVVLFFIGYKQTVGAKKERIKAANAELSNILVRRVVLEKYAPTEEDLTRLVEGKARDYRVRNGDLMSEAQFLNTVFTRIMESDLIPAEQRVELLKRITPAMSESEATPVSEKVVEEARASEKFARRSRALVILMAVLTSVVGGLVTVLPELKTLQATISEVLPAMIATAVASLAAIATLVTVLRLRGAQEETGKAKEVSFHLGFEEEVRKVLHDAKVGYQAGSANDMPDFMVRHNDRTILIEAKAWRTPIPTPIIRRIGSQLQAAARRIGATDIVLVTPARPVISGDGLPEDVKVMSLREFRRFMAEVRTKRAA